MAGMYPDDQIVSLFGTELCWPGMDPDTGKFTNGSFSDPLVKPSFIPAQTINLIVDNVTNLLTALGADPNNTDLDQLQNAVTAALALKANLASPALTGTPIAPTAAPNTNNTQIATTEYVDRALNSFFPIGMIYLSVENVNPATFIGGTWTVWGKGRVPVGVDTSQPEFDTVEKTNSSGAKTHTLSQAEMPSHTHTQNGHAHNMNGHQHENAPMVPANPSGNNVGVYTPWGIGQHRFSGSYNSFNTGSAGAGLPSTSALTSGNWDITSSVTPAINNTGGGAAHNNLQPYITCYMWKRTG
jgi:microcystin-dependent protein